MKNKILLLVDVPEIEKRYEVFVPINKRIGSVILLLTKAVNELSDGAFPLKNNAVLYNGSNGSLYEIDALIKDTNLENGTVVILL
jgi:hypothetical protein